MKSTASEPDPSYLNSVPPIFHQSKVDSVCAVVNSINSHPLIGVLSSLSSNTSDLHGIPKVNLQPLVVIPVFACPRPDVAAAFDSMKPGKPRAVEMVERRGGGYCAVLDFAALHAEGS